MKNKGGCCNGPNFHGMVRGRVVKNPNAGPSLTKAMPGGTRAGGMTPSSWQGGTGSGSGRSKQTKSGWSRRDGWIGW